MVDVSRNGTADDGVELTRTKWVLLSFPEDVKSRVRGGTGCGLGCPSPTDTHHHTAEPVREMML